MCHCRQFLALLSELRLKCLEMTPSQILRHVIVESGYLEYHIALVEKARQKKAADRQAEEHVLRSRIGSDDDDESDEEIELAEDHPGESMSPKKRSKLNAGKSSSSSAQVHP